MRPRSSGSSPGDQPPDTPIPQRWIVDAQNRELPRLGHPGSASTSRASAQTRPSRRLSGTSVSSSRAASKAMTETTGASSRKRARPGPSRSASTASVSVAVWSINLRRAGLSGTRDMQAGSGSTDCRCSKCSGTVVLVTAQDFEDGPRSTWTPDDDEDRSAARGHPVLTVARPDRHRIQGRHAQARDAEPRPR